MCAHDSVSEKLCVHACITMCERDCVCACMTVCMRGCVHACCVCMCDYVCVCARARVCIEVKEHLVGLSSLFSLSGVGPGIKQVMELGGRCMFLLNYLTGPAGFSLFFFLFFFLTEFHHVPSVVPNSLLAPGFPTSCLRLLNIGVMGAHHHTWLFLIAS